VEGPPVRLESGDVLLVPHGDSYALSTAPGMRGADPVELAREFFGAMAAGRLPPVVIEGGGGPQRVELVCGFLGCDAGPFNPVLAALPRLVHLRRPEEPAADRLASLVDFALAETRERRSGGQCVLLRLSELMFVEVVRRYLASLPAEESGWLAGLRDPTVGRALALLHARPAEPWTLEKLAREVGASRSALAERFARLAGQPPMQYLASWRMQLATCLLAEGDAKVLGVAAAVGYESESAFSRAFKRIVGVPPARWRRAGTTAPAAATISGP
jgi:AraC-like DNA-binding protein